MAIIKYDPFRSFGGLTRKMDNFLNNFNSGISLEYGSFLPKVDISEDEKMLYIHAELPGLTKDDFKITVNDDSLLVIKGSKNKENEVKNTGNGRTYHRIERSYGEFTRSFMLPENVKKDSVKAKFEEGVLHLSLEKIEPVMPKEIEVSVN
jgi:HSP20 family protein